MSLSFGEAKREGRGRVVRRCTVASLLVSSILSITYSNDAYAEADYLSIAPYGTFVETKCGDQSTAVGLCGHAQRDDKGYFIFARSISSIMLPPLVQPAKSLGEVGSQFSFVTTYAGLLNGDLKKAPSQWNKSFLEGEPTRHFFVGNLSFRKGLPYSLEIGLNASYAFNTNVLGFGFDFKYAFLEGYTYVPDMAAVFSMSTIVGVRNFIQGSTSLSLLASKDLGISGTFSITPRVGYQLVYSGAISTSMNSLPQDSRTTVTGKNPFDPYFYFGYHDVGVDVTNGTSDDSGRHSKADFKERSFPLDQRLLAGLDFNIWIVKVLLETSYLMPTQTLQVALGLGLTY